MYVWAIINLIFKIGLKLVLIGQRFKWLKILMLHFCNRITVQTITAKWLYNEVCLNWRMLSLWQCLLLFVFWSWDQKTKRRRHFKGPKNPTKLKVSNPHLTYLQYFYIKNQICCWPYYYAVAFWCIYYHLPL